MMRRRFLQYRTEPKANTVITVMHVIDTGGPGGAETVFLQTASGLDPSKFRSRAIVANDGWLATQLRQRNLTPYILEATGSFNGRYLARLGRLARALRADVIVAHLYGSAVYASVAGRLLGIPVVSVLHGQTDVSGSDRFSRWKAAFVRWGSREVVFVSDRLKRDLAPRLGLPASRCAVIPNGVDTAIYRPQPDRSLRAELGLAEDVILIGAIGNVRPPKAYDLLLRAARTLVDRLPRVHLVIAGEGDNALGRDLAELCDRLGLAAHVTFLGLRADIPRILNNLDVYVLSSRTEGFSIACIEAMACGIPVVATRSGGPDEILAGDAGLLVPTDDPGAIAAAVERIVTSKDLADRLTATALQRVHEEYALGRMLSRYEQLLARVAE